MAKYLMIAMVYVIWLRKPQYSLISHKHETLGEPLKNPVSGKYLAFQLICDTQTLHCLAALIYIGMSGRCDRSGRFQTVITRSWS
jgi:hypothetical protein